MGNGPGGNMRGRPQQVFHKVALLLFALNSRTQLSRPLSFEFIPTILAAAQPLFPPPPHSAPDRIGLDKSRRQSQEQQISVMAFCQKCARVLVTAFVPQ